MRRRPEVRACEIAQKNHTSTRCGTRRFASPKPRRRRTTLSTHQVFTLTLQRCIRVFTNPLYDLSFSRMLSADTLPTLFFRVFSACLERASFDEEPRGAAEENASGKGLRLAFHSAFLRQACGLVETPSARWPEGTGLFLFEIGPEVAGEFRAARRVPARPPSADRRDSKTKSNRNAGCRNQPRAGAASKRESGGNAEQKPAGTVTGAEDGRKQGEG